MDNSKDLDLRNCYNIDKRALIAIGIFPKPTYGKTYFYATRFIVLFLFLFCYILSMLAFVIGEFHKHLKIIETLLLMISVINSLVKLSNLFYNNEKIRTIEDIFENELLYQMNTNQQKDMNDAIGMTQNIAKYYRFAVFVAWIAYNTFPLLDSTNDRRLVIPAYYPWSMANLIIYIATYVYQSIMLLLSACLNTVPDVLFAMFCTIICQEFKILKGLLQTVNYHQDAYNIQMGIKKNVLFHNELIRATKTIEEIFSYGILSQFAASISVICFTGFELILFSPDTSDLFMFITYGVHLLSYMACMVVQVSIYCSFGHNVMTESSDIGQAQYLSNWYMSDLSIRKELLILMERVKKPIILTAGKLFPLTLTTLTMIFRSSYSFFAVLQRTT